MAPSFPERVLDLLGQPQLGFLSTVRPDEELIRIEATVVSSPRVHGS